VEKQVESWGLGDEALEKGGSKAEIKTKEGTGKSTRRNIVIWSTKGVTKGGLAKGENCHRNNL